MSLSQLSWEGGAAGRVPEGPQQQLAAAHLTLPSPTPTCVLALRPAWSFCVSRQSCLGLGSGRLRAECG